VIQERTTEEKLAEVVGKIAAFEIGLRVLSKNVYTDLSAQDAAHQEDIANLTTMVNDLGNSLIELSDQSRQRTVNFVASLDGTDERAREMNDRLHRVEKRLDNSAGFANGSIQDAFRLLRELRADLNGLRRSLPDGCEYPDCEPPQPEGAAEGAIAHVPAPFTGTPVAESEFTDFADEQLSKGAFADWQERTRSDAEFLRYIATQRYDFPSMVKDGLLNIAERLDNAADGSDGSWV